MSVSDSLADGSGKVPITLIEYELMIEWGLTPEEFDNLPQSLIGEIIDLRSAKAEGEERYRKSQEKRR